MYLDRHLRHVIDELDCRGIVQLAAIGIGYEISKYFARSIKLSTLADFRAALSDQSIVRLLVKG